MERRDMVDRKLWVTTIMGYVAHIHKQPNSDYGVSFPKFPGCVTAGKTLYEAYSMAEEALTLHLEGLKEDENT